MPIKYYSEFAACMGGAHRRYEMITCSNKKYCVITFYPILLNIVNFDDDFEGDPSESSSKNSMTDQQMNL